jgi:Na+-translocating ferredoxin:NAD+ oxidoreductase RnfG subunit
MKIISLVLIIVVFLTLLAWAENYLQDREGIRSVFPSFQDYRVENYILDNQELKVFTVFSDKKILGWAVILDEIGKIRPITFLVGIDIQGRILGVRILEYRDIFGSEIKRRSFLRQFQGKSSKDSIIVGRDINAVTSATISSNAAASAVKKSLKVIKKKKCNR